MMSLNFGSLVLFGFIVCYVSAGNSEYHDEFTREWAVKVHDPLMADLIALETGFENKGLVNNSNNFFKKKSFHLFNK